MPVEEFLHVFLIGFPEDIRHDPGDFGKKILNVFEGGGDLFRGNVHFL